MCGRFAAHYTWSEVNAFSRPLTVTTPEPDPSPSYNIAPTQAAWVVIPDGNKLVASTMRWGLIPRWSQDGKPSFSSINARIETVSEKPAFREPWQRNRCLIPVSGYYEWSGIKQPYYIRGEGPILMLGGIFETWRSSGGAFIESFSILTTSARGAIAKLHDRRPIVLPPSLLSEWVRGDAKQAMSLALALPDPDLTFYRVGSEVGDARNSGPELIAAIQLSTPPMTDIV